MKEKVILIGAGSAMFTKGLINDLIQHQWDAELALVDIDPNALKTAEGLAKKMIEAKKAPLKLITALDRRDVLPGATVVICTIGVGGRRAWEQDVFIPRKYGIYQPVGDTVMPGGTSRALRMIPVMVEIAKDVLDLCPQALFFNYGNPMNPICRAIRKTTGTKVVGLCHGVIHVAKYLAKALEVSYPKLKYTAVGVNHLTWFMDIRLAGKNMMPRLHEIAKKRLYKINYAHLGSQFAEAGTNVRKKPQLANNDNPFSWQLFQLFGAFPAVLDRHVTEFFPQFFANGNYYGKKLGIDAYSFEKTISYGDRIYHQMQESALSHKPLPEDFFCRGGGEHEQVISIIENIRCNKKRIYSANLPNQGQVPNLMPDAIVESPAITTRKGLKAVQQFPLSSELVGTLASRLLWVETVVEAALEGNRAKFIKALILDGAVRSLEEATRLADDLLKAQAKFLPNFSK